MKPLEGIVSQVETCAVLLPDLIAEQIYIPKDDLSAFAVRELSGKVDVRSELALPSGGIAKPIHDEFTRKGAVKLAHAYVWDENLAGLEAALREHISRFVWLSEDALSVVTAFVLCSWQGHRFDTAPYLHLMGAPGSAKSRLLKVLGDVCYRAIRLGSSSSRSSLFRIADTYQGTLAMDESDMDPRSQEHKEVCKLLREGFQRGTLSTRTEGGHANWQPRAFSTFGMKILAGLGPFSDLALESRCVPLVLPVGVDPSLYPAKLPADYESQADAMRSRLLGWRLASYFEEWNESRLPGLEGRLQQVFAPLVAVTTAEASREALLRVAASAQVELKQERRDSREGAILAIMLKLAETSDTAQAKIYLQSVVSRANGLSPSPYADDITAREVASVCRQLQMEPTKDRTGRFVLFNPSAHEAALEQYGLIQRETEAA